MTRIYFSGAETLPQDLERKMFQRKDREAKSDLWLPTEELPTTLATAFYVRLHQALTASGFGDAVPAVCEPYCQDGSDPG